MKPSPGRSKFTVVVLGGLLGSAGVLAPTRAVGQSMFGTQGPVSQIGSNATGSPVGIQSSRGGGQLGTGTALTGAATGGGLGQGMAATSPYGTNTFGSQLGTSSSGFIGQGNAQGRFIGGQRNAQGQTNAQTNNFGNNRQFQAGGMGNRTTQFGNRATQGGRGANMGFGANQQFGQFGGAMQQSRTVIRPRQEIAFVFPQRNSEVIVQELNTRFERVAAPQSGILGVTVELDRQRTAGLTGTVASEEAKRLAGILAGLEPGVYAVRNNLVVRPGN